MSFVPGTPNYANDESLTKLIQLIKNQFSESLNGTIILRLTKAEYDAISPKSPNTVYYVTNVVTGEVECYLGDTKISGEGGGGSVEGYAIPIRGIMEWNSFVPEPIYISSHVITITIDLKDYNLQNASYNDNSGVLTPGGANNYVCTIDYIPLNGKTTMQISHAYLNNGDQLYWAGYLYDSSKSYMYSATSSVGLLNWSIGSGTKDVPTSATYIRIILSRGSGGSRPPFTPSDVREAWYNDKTLDYDPL